MKKRSVSLMKGFVYVFPVLLFGLIVSCTNGNQNNESQGKIDSLIAVNEKQNAHIQEMEGFITSLSQTMDSIDIQEKNLIADGNIEKRQPVNKETFINNLKKYKEIIERQRQQIEKLENQLAANKDEMSAKMTQIVAYYKQQLEEKDNMIASLQKNIAENKTNIRNLQSSVSNLLATTHEQEQKIVEQEKTMTRQNDMINTCYVRIGTKKDLKADGLLQGGFLKKTKLDDASFSAAKFTAMDMRKCIDIHIKSSKPKVLTQMPASSYSIVKNDDGTCYLHIIDPNKFWSISRYLVIQL